MGLDPHLLLTDPISGDEPHAGHVPAHDPAAHADRIPAGGYHHADTWQGGDPTGPRVEVGHWRDGQDFLAVRRAHVAGDVTGTYGRQGLDHRFSPRR